MNGAESLVETLLACGVDTCFANPGTSEMHFVAALDRIPGIRCVLGLFEGVVTGAADGYSRMTGRPAATLLHCGPGLANGLANLHNARRANAMVVNCIGDQASYHRPFDAPLTADTEGFARGVSAWVRTSRCAEHVGADAAAAVQAAWTPPGHVVSLILPSDTCWNPGGLPGQPLPVPAPPHVAASDITVAARLLRSGARTLMILGNKALRAGPLVDAQRIAAATGAYLLAEGANNRIERGRGRPSISRVPYGVDMAVDTLAGFDTIILVGARDPVAFFAYPGKPSRLAPPGAHVHVLSCPEHDHAAALAALAAELDAPAAPSAVHEKPGLGRGAVTSEALGASLTMLMPDDAIVCDESITVGRVIFDATSGAAPHDWLQLCGGAIGDGMPLAVGAAIGAPGRRVVNLQADGSAMYTMQALWTQAREGLDVTTVILSNRKYLILLGELAAVGANPGRTALEMLDLGNPALNWVKLAAGMGVEGTSVETMEAFNDAFAASLKRQGPFLIELVM